MPNNGIPCTCWSDTPCHASHHTDRPETFEEYKDSRGRQIYDGDKLQYVNPRFPDREQPIHVFYWNAEKKRGEFVIDGKRRACRHGGRFAGNRFTIIEEA